MNGYIHSYDRTNLNFFGNGPLILYEVGGFLMLIAYKFLKDIIDVIEDSVEVIEVLKPVYNFKASETVKFGKNMR